MANEVTLWEAIKTLLPLIGTGGATAIALAWLGTRKAREKPQPHNNMVQALLADHFAAERVTTELSRVADEAAAVAHAINRVCDRIDMVSMWEQRRRDGDR